MEYLGKPLTAMDRAERADLLAAVCLMEGRARDELEEEVDAFLVVRGTGRERSSPGWELRLDEV